MTDLTKALLEKCEFDFEGYGEEPYIQSTKAYDLTDREIWEFQRDSAQWQHARLLPIIRALLSDREALVAALEFMTMPLTGKNPTVESLLETIATDDVRGLSALTASEARIKALIGE